MNFTDNFGTNLTSSTSAGVTTSPLNSIPTIDAPFYLAFDALNVNTHYEIVQVTSKTATNVNHAATVYDHSAADEEVRMVVPARFFEASQNLPEGTMFNGKIVPSVGSNNLTVALKTNAGADPSVTDPIYAMIGGTLRVITSALSVTKNAATNWCNAGSAELATKEIDYFAYLGYNATDGVVIGFSRIPYANLYSDFSATTTNEKYAGISTITNAVAGDNYVNIGRFAATLSAGAGYTWSVPTFTASNLIQKPIYETRWLSWLPTYTGEASMTFGSVATTTSLYKIIGRNLVLELFSTGTVGGTPSQNIYVSTPIGVVPSGIFRTPAYCYDSTVSTRAGVVIPQATKLGFVLATFANWGAGAGREIGISIQLEF